MGLLDKIKGEFIDIIEWQDSSQDTIVWRFPRYQNEIKMGAKLTVRESQVAVFMNEGWKYGFNSPFKVDVYFVSTRQFTDQKWGTKNPITLEDQRFGLIELRAFGTYAFQVTQADTFLKEISGTDANFSTEGISGQLRSLIVTKFSDAVGEGNLPIEKFAANLEELSELGQQKLNSDFAAYGLRITKFLVENVSLPDDLKKEIFEYSRLNKIDMQKLAHFKAAKSIEKAAENPSGVAGAGVGVGVGFGIGNMMAGVFGQNMQPQQGAAMPPPLPGSQYFAALNGQQSGPFTLEQLGQMALQGTLSRDTLVWKQGMAGWTAAATVGELSRLFEAVPPPLPPSL
jgi:membrane protease subunit (stomatin/prohibitin family)